MRKRIDRERLKKLLTQKLSWAVIAQRLGCNKNAAKKVAKKLGLTQSPFRYSDEAIQQVLDIYLGRKYSAAMTGQQLGMTKNQVLGIARRHWAKWKGRAKHPRHTFDNQTCAQPSQPEGNFNE